MEVSILWNKFKVIATQEKLTIADSFVVKANKIGTWNGEAKIYLGNNNRNLQDFYWSRWFEIKCFLLKADLLKYLEETKIEYLNPEQPYLNKEDLPKCWQERKNMVQTLPESIEFILKDQLQIAWPRVYGNSSDSGYNWIRELCLPNISYISILKISDINGSFLYYFRLFADYFGEVEHPFLAKNEDLEIENSLIEPTEKKQIYSARVWQWKYREKLLELCQFCPISLVSDERLLIASHIKPWAVSNNFERTDPMNGFMLTPTYDYLFDRGFLSFTNDKKTILSPFLSDMTYSKIGISNNKTIPHLQIAGREWYLEYHRKNILKWISI